MKANYKVLGLNHIFTPSGFHLSAVIFPFMKFLKTNFLQMIFILSIGSGLFFLPGLGALKRMVLIKSNQKILGMHAGFISALILDMWWGSFQNSPLSFTYSFLFIGIIYSGLRGLGLIVWFFIAQMMIAYFQGNDISILLLIFSPLLNFIFAMIMPALFLLAFPLWNWQLSTGLFILRFVQKLVDACSGISFWFPTLEVNIFIFVIILLMLFKRKKLIFVSVLIFCSSVNNDTSKIPSLGNYEFRPQGNSIRTIYREEDVMIYFSDGRCRMKLVRGVWFENCSPRRRSSHKKKN
jgi:competence protein ComEC